MTRILGYYDGSRLLEPLSSLTSLGIDEFNFVICQLLCLILAYPYRVLFPPEKYGPTTRHIIQIAIGLPITFFCFGKQIFHVLAQSISCYIVMKTVRPGVMENMVFTIALGYLCIGHMYRQLYDYGNYVLDITGPLMLNTQRVSSIAYSYRDGLRLEKDDKKITPFMKKYAIKELPNLLEYTSYVFCFHTLMAGPFAFYKDYQRFIDGSNVIVHNQQDETSNNTKESKVSRLPSPMAQVSEKLVCAAVFGYCMYNLTPKCTVSFATEPAFETYSLPMKMCYLVLSTFVYRAKYYFAWKLVEAININAGLGFNGYDETGKAKWDLMDNVNVRKLEFATSIKVVIDNWNITTTLWLRYIIYERLHSSFLVFLFSAFWHGFYGGYYLTFVTASFCTSASRQLRRNLRHYFQSSVTAARFYDCLTYTVSKFTLAYITFPFILMDFWPSMKVYQQMFFFIHIISIAVIIIFNFVKFPPTTTTSTTTVKKSENSHTNHTNIQLKSSQNPSVSETT